MSDIENIVIKKDNVGDEFDLYQESSDDSSVDVKRTPRRAIPIVTTTTKHKKHYVSTPSAMYTNNAPKPFVTKPVVNKVQELDDMYEVFTNPDKKRHEVEPSEDQFDNHEPINMHDNTDDIHDDMLSNNEYEDNEQPSSGYSTIEDEKQDLLYKLYRLQSKGIPVSKKYNINSDIKEMRNEFNKIKRDNEVNSSIRFSRRMLMACVTGMEFMNKRYDPFDVKLDGWSDSVMENVDDYDNVFERLHDKYASRVSMAPEIELLLSLAGSAFMFHLTNSMFTNMMPNLKDMAQQNPDILKNMMETMASNMQQQSKGNPTTNTTTNNIEQSTPIIIGQNSSGNNFVRDMNPPSFDISSLIPKTFLPTGNNNFKPTRNTDISLHNQNSLPNRSSSPTPSNIFSDESSIDEGGDCDGLKSALKKETSTRSISYGGSDTQISLGGTRRKKGKKVQINDTNTISL